jgi:cell division protein FtsN
MEAGLIDYWINQKWTSKMKSHSDEGGEPKVLSLAQLSAAFIICIVGILLAFVVFVIEKLHCRKSQIELNSNDKN